MFGSSARLWLRFSLLLIVFFIPAAHFVAAEGAKTDPPKPGEPIDPKAHKTYLNALEWLKIGKRDPAIEEFRKAARQDSHCTECFRQAYSLAYAERHYKDAEQIARDWLPIAASDDERAVVHYRIALALQQQATNRKKEQDKCFDESCDEFKRALQLEPKFTTTHYALGISLAHLHQDDAARAEFSTFLANDTITSSAHQRAQRFLDHVELARARMAPAFSVTALDGKQISLDSFAGKVVLIDFWATWCGPCREALPHIRDIAHRFQEQPLVVISISLDRDEKKWKEFVAKNKMTWLQYRDGGFEGPIARAFDVNAIPATFTIDTDGVLEDQHVGDGNIEGKLKKLLADAIANQKPEVPAVQERAPAAVGSPETPPGSN